MMCYFTNGNSLLLWDIVEVMSSRRPLNLYITYYTWYGDQLQDFYNRKRGILLVVYVYMVKFVVLRGIFV